MELGADHKKLLIEIAAAGIAPDGVPYFYGGAFADLCCTQLVAFWSFGSPRPEAMHGDGIPGRWYLTERGAELLAAAEQDAPLSVTEVRGVSYPRPWYAT